jgi:hypothetical protein
MDEQLDQARRAGIYRALHVAIEELRKEQSLHKKASSGYYNLEIAILRLQKLTIDEVDN